MGDRAIDFQHIPDEMSSTLLYGEWNLQQWSECNPKLISYMNIWTTFEQIDSEQLYLSYSSLTHDSTSPRNTIAPSR